jgi:ABC-type xylose transport system permease subunit
MPLPIAPDTKSKQKLPQNEASKASKANNELLLKALLCILIGLGVLLSPYFFSSPGIQGIVAQSSLVGWFALALGLAFAGLYLRRRINANTGK